MSKLFASLIAGAVVVGGLVAPIDAAYAKKKKNKGAAHPAAARVVGKAQAKGATNIADCAKMDVSMRDSCISRSRPVRGADLYKAAGAGAAAAPTVTKAAKGAKGAAGATKIGDCAAMKGGERDTCISRSAPVTGAALYAKWKK